MAIDRETIVSNFNGYRPRNNRKMAIDRETIVRSE